MLSGEGNKNGEKTIGLISKKATLHVQHTFFVHFFAVVLHDHNVKLPETSWLHVLWRKCRTCSCSLFFSLSLIFTLVATSISHFLNAATKCYVVSPKKMYPLFFLTRSSSFSRWASLPCRPTFSFSFSLSLYSKFVDMIINLSLIRFPISSLLTL